jgi:enoyl-CoA hydratase/carnithine racemase
MADRRVRRRPAARFHAFIDCLSTFDKPLPAAVHSVIGIGLAMLLHCDIVYMARSARIRAPFVSFGLVPEAASSYLRRSLGR